MRKIYGLKLFRTYLGGSKKKEIEIMDNTGFLNDDDSKCDWISFKNIVKKRTDDVYIVYSSWKRLTQILSIGLLIFSLLIFTMKLQILSLIIFVTSLLLMLIHLYFNLKVKETERGYFLIDCFIDEKINESFNTKF